MKATKIKILHWLPRVLSILSILFISVFALDSFSSNLTFWQQMEEFGLHLIPSFVLLTVLLIAWKWEFLGGVVFVFISLLLSPLIFYHNYEMNHDLWMSLSIILLITFPLLVVGALFIGVHFAKKKNNWGRNL